VRKEITLSPVVAFDSYALPVEREILAALGDLLYRPLLDILAGAGLKAGAPPPAFRPRKAGGKRENTVRQSAGEIVAQALRDRRIWFANGAFSGRFDARVSRALRDLGATPGRRAGQHSFHLPPSRALPAAVGAAAAESLAASREVHAVINRFLIQIYDGISAAPHPVDLKISTETLARAAGGQFDAATAPLRGVHEIPAGVQPAMRAALDADFNRNVNLGIKGFTQERVAALRELVVKNAEAGHRSDRLVEIVKAEIGVGQRRAEFIARQETALYVSKLTGQRYRDAGITRYRWSTSNDRRVRHDHRELNNRVFDFSSPPIVDRATGRRANPGEDFNCRCAALPIVVIDDFAEAELDRGFHENAAPVCVRGGVFA
jgi:SPP1 gp7 family putative phage head morphogenesis protein